jgi:hypothetical protein
LASPCQRALAEHGVVEDFERGRRQAPRGVRVRRQAHLLAAAQVAFEKAKVLKLFFHFIGSRVETRRFQAMGLLQLDSQLVQPRLLDLRRVIHGRARGVRGERVLDIVYRAHYG